MAAKRDYYEVLGVAQTASADEVKSAYRRLARKHHPDVNQGDKAAESRIKEINEAYEVLGDADKRKKYDELGANWRAYENMPPPGAGGGRGFGGGFPGGGGFGGGVHTMTEQEMQEMFGGAGGFSDFFQAFFGGDF